MLRRQDPEGSGGFRRVLVCAGVGTGGRVRKVPESYGLVCCLATLSGALFWTPFGDNIVHMGKTTAQKKWRPCSQTWHKDYATKAYFFPPNSKTCYGVFSSEELWCDPVQLQPQVPEKVPEGSGGFWCRKLMRFQRVPVQKAAEVPEGSGAESWWGSGGFRCRWLMRFLMVPAQIADEVPEGSGADSRQGSGGFRRRWLMRFRMVLAQIADKVPKVPVQIADEVPEGSGADSRQGSRWLMRFRMVLAQIADKVPKVPVQIADKVLEGSGAESWRGSGGFWCRKLMRFRRVAGQIADEVLEGSGTHSKQSSGGFRYKNIPRSSKLLGITHGFIFTLRFLGGRTTSVNSKARSLDADSYFSTNSRANIFPAFSEEVGTMDTHVGISCISTSHWTRKSTRNATLEQCPVSIFFYGCASSREKSTPKDVVPPSSPLP